MKTIFIDMDGVIVDLSQNINICFNNHANLNEKYKNFQTISQVYLEIQNQSRIP
tara:strand:+ start:17 stop:178 length:162 start_codon:yes stop_codon:yes gene_type:complete